MPGAPALYFRVQGFVQKKFSRMNALSPLQIKQLSSSPILESMVFVNLAVNLAISLGVKDKKAYKNLKKHYYIKRKIVSDEENQVKEITSGWPILQTSSTKFIGTKTLYHVDSHETRIWYYKRIGMAIQTIHYELCRFIYISGTENNGMVWVSYTDNRGHTGPAQPFSTYFFEQDALSE